MSSLSPATSCRRLDVANPAEQLGCLDVVFDGGAR